MGRRHTITVTDALGNVLLEKPWVLAFMEMLLSHVLPI